MNPPMSDPTPAGAAPRDEARIPYRGEADEDLLELARKHLYLTEHDRGYKVRGWDAFKAALAAAPRADQPSEAQIAKTIEIVSELGGMFGEQAEGACGKKGLAVARKFAIRLLTEVAAARAPGREP